MHLQREEIEAFLRGEEPADPATFRRHVEACAECAARLEEEARIDTVLVAVAASGADARPRHAFRRRIWIAAAVLSLIVGVVVARSAWMPAKAPTPVAEVDGPGVDPETTDARIGLAAARTVAPDEMGAWTTVGAERQVIARVPAPTPD